LHLVGYLYYWQMGFNSVFKGLTGHSPELLLAFSLDIMLWGENFT